MSDASSATTAFGRLLRFWRGVFQRTQEDLALELDSSPRHISRLENGRVQPSRLGVYTPSGSPTAEEANHGEESGHRTQR
ncbi:MAG: helix-turn-helix transcriptional regulator [Myxococcota bacterium]|nr:helix-turn-helix transcriptional regulator [Myxococcota bacterium]